MSDNGSQKRRFILSIKKAPANKLGPNKGNIMNTTNTITYEEIIKLVINGNERSALVKFNFTPGEKGFTCGLPEDCTEKVDDEFDLLELKFVNLANEKLIYHDVSFLLDTISDEVIKQLKKWK